jgi:hypothetical protein
MNNLDSEVGLLPAVPNSPFDDNKRILNMNIMEIFAHLLLASHSQSTTEDKERLCQIMHDEGGAKALHLRILPILKTSPETLWNILAETEQRCAAGSGCCDEREIDIGFDNAAPVIATSPAAAPAPTRGISDAEIVAWLNCVLARVPVPERLPEVPKLPIRAAAVDPTHWGRDLAPRIGAQMTGRRGDSINVLRFLLARAIKEGLLHDSIQLRMCLSTNYSIMRQGGRPRAASANFSTGHQRKARDLSRAFHLAASALRL